MMQKKVLHKFLSRKHRTSTLPTSYGHFLSKALTITVSDNNKLSATICQ